MDREHAGLLTSQLPRRKEEETVPMEGVERPGLFASQHAPGLVGLAREAGMEADLEEELTEEEIRNQELGESIRRSKTPASHADWSGSDPEEEREAKDVEMGEEEKN